MKKKNLTILLVFFGLMLMMLFLSFKTGILFRNPDVLNQVTTPIVMESPTNEFSYKGRDNVDALTLLKEKTEIEQDKSGMVVLINGRKADVGKREFWGFYVNGKMAEVGAADFKTKNTDVINWKIEKF